MKLVRHLVWFALLGLVACSSEDPAPTTPTGNQNQGICANETRGDTFQAGMEKTSTNKQYRVALVQGSPAPPKRDENTWTIKIMDAAGNPVSKASLVVKPSMPDHSHAPVPATVSAMSDVGMYEITKLNLFMPGFWQVDIAITNDQGQSDNVDFGFCIEG
jgi:hypothetical protein